jgi:SulP family sulfate permease
LVAGIALDALGCCQRWGISAVGTIAIDGAHPALPAMARADWRCAGPLAMALASIPR